jgi:hypothetical protein
MHILVGYGEVGKGIHSAFRKTQDITVHDPAIGWEAEKDDSCDILLVAIPYSDDFIEIIKNYQYEFQPKSTVIFSTVPIGTSKQLGAIHSPIEGDHGNMAEYILKATHWIGGKDPRVEEFFKSAGCKIMVTSEPEHTEFLKLRSTTIYGINIEFARYCSEIAYKLGLSQYALEWYDMDYNILNTVMNRPQYVRYVLKEPKGRIGGHCVLPNAEILNEQFPHPFIQTMLDFNKEKG